MRTVLFVLALLLAPIASAQTTHQVVLRGIEFIPASLTIEAGDTVEWTNEQGFHNVEERFEGSMPDGFGNDPAGPGWTYSFTFDEVGEYQYLCIVHSTSMFGDITVVQGSSIGEAGPLAPGDLLLSPPTPNPTASSSTFTLVSGSDGLAEVSAYDLLGRRVAVLWSGRLAAGTQKSLSLDASRLGLPAGQYIVRAQADGARAVRAIVVVGR